MAKTYGERSLEIIKEHVEKLGLGDKPKITRMDMYRLRQSLRESFNHVEMMDIEKMKTPEALQDFIVNTIYGDE